MAKDCCNGKLHQLMFKKYMEISTDGVLGVDVSGRIVEINESYCDFLGIARDDAIGKPVQTVIPTTKMLTVIKKRLTEIDSIHHLRDDDLVGVITSRAVVLDENNQTAGAIAQIRFVDRTSELAERLQKLQAEVHSYKEKLLLSNHNLSTFESIVCSNRRMKELSQTAMKMSGHDFPVLLLGETGTGKEVFAHAIHNASPRSKNAFIHVNCAAIPSELLESELFGYEEGAFSGSRKGGKPGKIELADNGTLFLDEIADMPLPMQGKLLLALQDGNIDRLGAVKSRKVNVRIMAATNKNLLKKVEEKTFRDDLYYRINVMRLELPPLRERTEDIPLLTEFYLTQLNLQYGMQKFFSRAAGAALRKYSWPGNVRELRNAVFSSFILTDGNLIDLQHLPVEIAIRRKLHFSYPSPGNYRSLRLQPLMQELEKEIILQALKECNNNYAAASRFLGIHRGTLYKKVRKLLPPEE
ncbi:MAG: sigma 54-interacting transcriptional regulator [Deltaproteobacteria bacterium]|jgi:PAS domain S-box-containing protein|nr:sigma 54-interacting transcriptional regulator [Deltaproteobacteria bacterium]